MILRNPYLNAKRKSKSQWLAARLYNITIIPNTAYQRANPQKYPTGLALTIDDPDQYPYVVPSIVNNVQYQSKYNMRTCMWRQQ